MNGDENMKEEIKKQIESIGRQERQYRLLRKQGFSGEEAREMIFKEV